MPHTPTVSKIEPVRIVLPSIAYLCYLINGSLGYQQHAQLVHVPIVVLILIYCGRSTFIPSAQARAIRA